MVRRWSYINELNSLSLKQSHKVRSGALDTLVNTFMYLREDYPDQTKNFRTSWARRRHMNNYLYLSNVLINWAKEYRFYRNYNRSLGFHFFTKNCYLSVNITIGRSSLTPKSKFHRSVVGSSLTRKMMNFYFKTFSGTRFNFLLTTQPSVWSYASYTEPYSSSIDAHNGAPYLPAFKSGISKDYMSLFDEYRGTFLPKLLALSSNLFMSKVTQLYSLLIKLLVHKLQF